MTGDVPEETYHAQQKLQVDVLDLFRMVDQAANGALTGALPRREIQVLLRGISPNFLLSGSQNCRSWCVYALHMP